LIRNGATAGGVVVMMMVAVDMVPHCLHHIS